MNKSFVAVALLVGSAFLSAFNPVSAQTLSPVTIKDLPADPANPQGGQPGVGSGKYTLFSLKDGKQVPNSDSSTAKWDVGFRATTIIVNGGAGRVGKGGAAVQNGTFDALTAVPENVVFAQDESSKLAILTGSGNGWYTYGGGAITPTADKVLLIRTADGKYAKMEIQSYYKGGDAGGESRYYTFRYVYQPDGSKNLK
ncbi:HmuY family protein [Tellurirhabdus bombi]|uniref:HmuY family protein n=1 Tax=Tellurirhabdus bombi TaxID=2907205 RepID=UPI001F2E41C2|nr:HmuY family protein [Tellurirhabdus bombi]